jgi:hypothetical protein
MFWQYDGQKLAVVKRSSTFQVAGSIALPSNSNFVTGTGTRFTEQLAAGDRVVIRGMSHVVSQVISNTSLTITPDYRGVTDLTSAKMAKTNDLVVPQAYWNRDTADGKGDSGYNIDVTKMQMIGIQHTWYGAGFIDFMLRGSNGDYVFVHRFRNSNYNIEAYMRSGNQPVRYEVINEGAKDKLTSAITSTDTVLPLSNAYFYPNAGTVIVDSELISYTANNGTSLVNCTRGSSLTQFAAGSQRTFTGSPAASHSVNAGVILVSNTITPIISHWGSAYMIDGQFDSDRGYIFNYAATGTVASLNTGTLFLIRLAPSVSNAQTGDLGVRELLNRAQMLLSNISITSDSVTGGGAIVVQGVLNPINYPTDPTLITWTGLNSLGAGGQPSFAQVASGGSVTWGGNVSTSTATIQSAFTTTLTAKSFAPITTSLTAISFSPVVQAISAASFATATSTTYNSAFSTARSDFLVANSVVSALTTPLSVGDTISAPPYVSGGQSILSIATSYTTLAGIPYTRIVMSGVANGNSPGAVLNGQQNISTSIGSSVAARYNTAVSASRTDFLITQAQLSSITIAVTDSLSTATYITTTHTISNIVSNYTVIAGVSYAQIIMSGAANITSNAGSGNNISITATSAATSTYGSALNTSRSDFLITDSQYATSGIATSDILSVATYVTGSQTIQTITTGYINIGGTSYTRIVMSAAANATSTSGSGNDVVLTVTASGSAASYVNTNYLFYTSTTWLSSGASLGTKVASSYTQFPAGTSVAAVSTRTYAGTTVYRVTFTQTSNSTISAGATTTFQFGSPYALPGEQVFSFVNNPGNTDSLELSGLKEMTSTAIGGRGTFPNGPDVLAINVYKVSGSPTPVNVILRWSEAQA